MAKLPIISSLIAGMFLAACSGPAPDGVTADEASSGEVNVYSARHYDADLALYEQFTEETGIKVNLLEGNSDELIARMKAEGDLSPADLLVTVDAGRLWRAVEADVLTPLGDEALLNRVPDAFRHPDNLWIGLTKRARVIVYNEANGRPEGIDTYADLADPSLNGQVCIRSSSNIYNISLMASLIAREGEEAAENWARGVVSNFARRPQGNDTAQLRAVAAGECGVTLANTYYIGRLAASDAEADRALAEQLGIIYPNQDTTGTHVNISGAGLTKYAPNRENALKLLAFLTRDDIQTAISAGNNEYPVVPGAPVAPQVQALGEFVEDDLNVDALGRYQNAAVRAFDRAGWE